jgi:hypothetical protein
MNNGHDPNGRREHDAFIARLLGARQKQEALAWLKGNAPNEERLIGECQTNRESIALVKGLYKLGAVEVTAVHFRALRKPKRGKRTGKLVVTLPEDSTKRKALLEWCKAQGENLGYTPEADHGESHLFLLLT